MRVKAVVRQEPKTIYPLGALPEAKQLVVEQRVVVPVQLQEQANRRSI